MNRISLSNEIMTAMDKPISTLPKVTPKYAPRHIIQSILSIFQRWMTAGMSMMPTMATIIMEERTTSGVYWNNGVKNNSVIIITIAMIILETAVLHPALKFTALLENGPTSFSHNNNH